MGRKRLAILLAKRGLVNLANKLTQDGWLLLATGYFRMFAFGLLSVVLEILKVPITSANTDS